jgi:hypothetical protein
MENSDFELRLRYCETLK